MMAETAEELGKRPEIRKELERATGKNINKRSKLDGGDKFWFVIHAIVLAICAAIYSLSARKSFRWRTLLLALLKNPARCSADHDRPSDRTRAFGLRIGSDRGCFHSFHTPAHRASGYCASRRGHRRLDHFCELVRCYRCLRCWFDHHRAGCSRRR